MPIINSEYCIIHGYLCSLNTKRGQISYHLDKGIKKNRSVGVLGQVLSEQRLSPPRTRVVHSVDSEDISEKKNIVNR